MATFNMSAGVLTEEWAETGGFGGINGWSCRGICTDTQAAVEELTRYQLTRYRFEQVPYRREIVVIPLDGTSVVVGRIDVRLGPITTTNTAPNKFIEHCVKLGPVQFSNYAPMQDSGTYSGLSLLSYSVSFQPLKIT